MPASARLAISHSAGLSLGQVTVTIVEGRRTFSNPALLADEIHKADFGDEGTRIKQVGAPAGTFRLFHVDELNGVTTLIATQVI